MKRIGFLSLICVALLAAGCNRNNNADMNADHDIAGTTGDARDGRQDKARQFVLDQLADGAHELQMARLAEQHAASADVKQFAAMMIKDHSKAGDQLKEIAARQNIQGPTELEDGKHTELMDRLSKLNGAEFDRAFMNAMVDDHQHAVDALEARADEHAATGTSGTVADDKPGEGAAGSAGTATTAPGASRNASDSSFESQVNQWAANTLPTVRMHLDRAKQLHDQLGSGIGDKMKKVMPGKSN
jgi:putative membrane protein